MTVTEAPTSEITVLDEPDDVQQEPRRRFRIRRGKEGAPKVARPLTPGATSILWVLVTLGLLALWFVSFGLVFSGVQQSANQRVLYSELREELAKATAPIGGSIEPGSPLFVMDATGIGIGNQVGVEGTSSVATRLGIGHLRYTPLPGQVGTSVLFGRSVTYGAPFHELSKALPGQIIYVTTGQGKFRFEVMDARRPGDPQPDAIAEGESRILLVGAEGAGAASSLTADGTVFVDAQLIGKPVDTPPGRPTSTNPDEAFGQGSRAGLVPLAMWLELLVMAVVSLVWARVRWGNWQVYLIGVPIVLALLWGTTNSAFILLPNIL